MKARVTTILVAVAAIVSAAGRARVSTTPDPPNPGTHVKRLPSRFGSDHYPVLAMISF